MKKQKFTFKTEKPTGKYRSFEKDYNYIKLNKQEVGLISDGDGFIIRFMVVKGDIMEDGNKNCDWKWVTLKKQSNSLQEAKDFLNNNIDSILQAFKIKIDERPNR